MVQELSCWQTTRQTDRQTDKQTDTVDNNTTLAVQVVIIQLLIISHLYSATHKATDVLQWEQYVVRIATMSYAQELAFCRKNWRATHKTYVQYIPPTPTGRNCFVASAVWTRIRNKLVTVSSCRRCEHTRWQSWPSLQFPVLTTDKWRHNDVIVENKNSRILHYTADSNVYKHAASLCYVISYFYSIGCRIVNLVTAIGMRSHRRIRRQSSWASCEFMYTPPTPTRRDATKQFRRVGVGGVYWA